MISIRTRWLGLCFVVLSVIAGVIVHRRQALCSQVPLGFARRARIQSASGTDTFVCHAMVEKLPPAEIVLAVTWWITLIAVARSVRVDVEHRRMKYRLFDES